MNASLAARPAPRIATSVFVLVAGLSFSSRTSRVLSLRIGVIPQRL